MNESDDIEDLRFLQQAIHMKEAAQKKEAAISAFIQSVHDEANAFITTERAEALKVIASDLCKERKLEPDDIGSIHGSSWNYPKNLSSQLRDLNPRWVSLLGEAQLILDRPKNNENSGRAVLENFGKKK